MLVNGKEIEVLNEFMGQQQATINQLQQQILFLTTKNNVLEKELTKLKNINSQQREQIEKLTKVDRKSLRETLENIQSDRLEPVLEEKPKERKSGDGSMFKNRGVRNGISN